MAAPDPTYPLYPIACLLSSIMLLLVFSNGFIRQNWNLGVVFLCFWLFFENLTSCINAIVWSDNADIKLFAYCDIVTRLQWITATVKPMATLIITRRLYLIVSRQSIDFPNHAARRKNLAIEWILGLGIPVMVAGPLYFVVQWSRFAVFEGFGCRNSEDTSVLALLLLDSWSVLPPLVSVVFYYPRVARVFYRQSRDIDRFLQSRTSQSVSRTNYFRILALASIDLLLTLPMGVTTVVLNVKNSLAQDAFPFYFGWTNDHANWEPQGYPYALLLHAGTSTIAGDYFALWSSPVLAFVIFGLFGVTSEARASYWHIIYAVGGWLGWKPTPCTRGARSTLGDIEFGVQTPGNSMSPGLDSQSSSRVTNAHVLELVLESKGSLSSETESGSKGNIGEVPRGPSDATQAERQIQDHAQAADTFSAV